MNVFAVRRVRMRLWWTTVLVLVALGGAGLAVAADRPHNPLQRPELTWRADRDAQVWIQALAAELAVFDQDVVALSTDGREVLSQLQALDLERMRAAQAGGDGITIRMDVAITRLSNLRREALEAVDESRLGPGARTVLEQMTSAALSAQQVPTFWRVLSEDSGRVADLVDALLRHDGLVFRATTAGRQAQWEDALGFLDQAAGPLRDATVVRDELGGRGSVETLDDLLDRYRKYDAALAALYTFVRDTGRQEGERFDDLQQRVERAQAALPTDTTFMSVIVSEAAGPSLTQSLVAIERAHGDILEALAAVAAADLATP